MASSSTLAPRSYFNCSPFYPIIVETKNLTLEETAAYFDDDGAVELIATQNSTRSIEEDEEILQRSRK